LIFILVEVLQTIFHASIPAPPESSLSPTYITVMKTFLVIAVNCLWLAAFSQSGSIGIGTTTPDASAVLDIQTTTKGVLIPRMTTAQRNSISTAATGLLVFDNTTGSFWFKSSTNWVELVDTVNNAWKRNGSNIYAGSAGNVGIGTNNPTARLDVTGNFILRDGASSSVVFREWTAPNWNINATMGNTVSGTDPGDLLLQIPQAPLFTAGNVGIGTATPTEKLEVSGTVKISGEINRPATGTANLVPICYGRVSETGSIISGTGNFSVSHPYPGSYIIDIVGFTSGDLHPHATVIVAPMQHGLYGINPGAATHDPVGPSYEDFFVTVKDHAGYVDAPFSFIVYLPGQ
jgi:hypothetical protein